MLARQKKNVYNIENEFDLKLNFETVKIFLTVYKNNNKQSERNDFRKLLAYYEEKCYPPNDDSLVSC